VIRHAYRGAARLSYCLTALFYCALGGCSGAEDRIGDVVMADAVERYRIAALDRRQSLEQRIRPAPPDSDSTAAHSRTVSTTYERDFACPTFTLGMMPQDQPPVADSQPTAERPAAGVPQGYWRKNVWRQMGHELKEYGTRDLWRGFKTSFWDVENALMLTAAMGVSVTMRETGVDDAVRKRTHGNRQLGDGGEVVQIFGNPGTHLAGAGIFWLTSALTRDAEQHEVARSLAQALTVTGITTLGLKAAVRTREPDGSLYGWPSGHTSSTVCAAAVLNEYYGPWVGVPCYALAGLVAYERIDSREHDVSDVVFGAMLGYVVGTSVARDEKARFPELWGMQVVPFTDIETGATGLALMKSW